MPGSHLSSETLRLPLSRNLINTEKQKSSTRDHLGFPMHRFQRLTDRHVYYMYFQHENWEMTGRLPSASTISKLNRDTESLLFLAPGNLFHAGAMVRYGQKTRARDTKGLVCSSGKHATGFLKEIPSRIRAETLFRICNLIHIRVLSLLGLRLILYCEHLYGLPPRGWHSSWWHTQHTHSTQSTHSNGQTNKYICAAHCTLHTGPRIKVHLPGGGLEQGYYHHYFYYC